MDIQSFENIKIIQNCESSKPTPISIKRYNSENKEDVSIWQEYRSQEQVNSNLTAFQTLCS
jgi:hypothetical protein